MNTCLATNSWSNQTTTPWNTSSQWPNWMQWATIGWPSWPCTISWCCISQGRLTSRLDALSRIDWDWELTSEVVRVILNTAMEGCSPLAKICTHSMTVVPSFLVGGGTARQETEGAVPKWMTPCRLGWGPDAGPRPEPDLSGCTKPSSWRQLS